MTGKQFCLLKSSIKLPGGLFVSNTLEVGGGGGVGGGLYKRRSLFILAKTMVSVLHKELEYKVEKPRIINKSELPVGEWIEPSWIGPHEVLQLWLINTVYHLLRGFTVLSFDVHFRNVFSLYHICLTRRSTFGYCSILWETNLKAMLIIMW